MATTIQVVTSGWTAASGQAFALPCHLNGSVAEDRVLPDHETPLDYNDIGELINESEIVSNGKGSPGFSIKGYHPEKDGIAAGLLAAEVVTAGSTSFDGAVATDGRL
jgi:hypothetical protein